MQVTSLLSEHEHDDDCGCCGHGTTGIPSCILLAKRTIAGVVFVLNAYVVDWIFQQRHDCFPAPAP